MIRNGAPIKLYGKWFEQRRGQISYSFPANPPGSGEDPNAVYTRDIRTQSGEAFLIKGISITSPSRFNYANDSEEVVQTSGESDIPWGVQLKGLSRGGANVGDLFYGFNSAVYSFLVGGTGANSINPVWPPTMLCSGDSLKLIVRGEWQPLGINDQNLPNVSLTAPSFSYQVGSPTFEVVLHGSFLTEIAEPRDVGEMESRENLLRFYDELPQFRKRKRVFDWTKKIANAQNYAWGVFGAPEWGASLVTPFRGGRRTEVVIPSGSFVWGISMFSGWKRGTRVSVYDKGSGRYLIDGIGHSSNFGNLQRVRLFDESTFSINGQSAVDAPIVDNMNSTQAITVLREPLPITDPGVLLVEFRDMEGHVVPDGGTVGDIGGGSVAQMAFHCAVPIRVPQEV